MILTVYLSDAETEYLQRIAGRRKFGTTWALHQLIAAHCKATEVAGSDPEVSEADAIPVE